MANFELLLKDFSNKILLKRELWFFALLNCMPNLEYLLLVFQWLKSKGQSN